MRPDALGVIHQLKLIAENTHKSAEVTITSRAPFWKSRYYLELLKLSKRLNVYPMNGKLNSGASTRGAPPFAAAAAFR